MRLVRLLGVQEHARLGAVGEGGRLGGRRRAGLDVAQKALEIGDQVAFDPSADSDDHPLRLVPAAQVVEERFARRGADGVLRADHVPAERLVAVEQLVVGAADEVARRVEVHVHLLDDDALLALDLVGGERRVADHVEEDVERRRPLLGRAADVVARVLLGGEGVDLAADPVDRGRDVARQRSLLGALEEHVLGEMRDPVRLAGLVARAGRDHQQAGHGLHLGHRRREDADPVRQRGGLVEVGHVAGD
jgi:hypothetical protein